MMLRVLAGAIWAAALAATSSAAESDAGLQGVTGVRVVVESMDEDARQCGISTDALDAAVRIPLSSARLLYKSDPAVLDTFFPYVYVNVNALKHPTGICVAAVEVSLARVGDFANGGNTRLAFATVWRKGSVLTGVPAGFGIRVANEVESYSKQFVGAWLRAN